MATFGEKYFVAHCQQELARLDDDGLVITRDGVPYAKVARLDHFLAQAARPVSPER